MTDKLEKMHVYSSHSETKKKARYLYHIKRHLYFTTISLVTGIMLGT